jgi:hypothetical protein
MVLAAGALCALCLVRLWVGSLCAVLLALLVSLLVLVAVFLRSITLLAPFQFIHQFSLKVPKYLGKHKGFLEFLLRETNFLKNGLIGLRNSFEKQIIFENSFRG